MVRLFFKFENPTPVQTPATIIDPTAIYPCFYLRNDHTDSCFSRNEKVTPDPGLVFHKFLTPGPKEKRRILLESTPVIRIRSHLCKLPEVSTEPWTGSGLGILQVTCDFFGSGYLFDF